MNEKELEEQLRIHALSAAQFSLKSREAFEEHKEAEKMFEREAGVVAFLRSQLNQLKNETKPNPKP